MADDMTLARKNGALLAIWKAEQALAGGDTPDERRALRELGWLRNRVRHDRIAPLDARVRVDQILDDPAGARDTYAF